MYWWFLGLNSRRSALENVLRLPTECMTIHVTVRLAMAAKRNKCRLLETRSTKVFSEAVTQEPVPAENGTALEGNGLAPVMSSRVRWCLPGKQTGTLEDAVSADEKMLLEMWTKIGTAEEPSQMQAITDRSRFVQLRQHINEAGVNGEDIRDQSRASFAEFLRKDLQFADTGLPSPKRMYPAPKQQNLI